MLGAALTRNGLETIGGLTLLGRAFLALQDAGVDRFAIVGSHPRSEDPALVSQALAGRHLQAHLVYFELSDGLPARIAAMLQVPQSADVFLLNGPSVVTERAMPARIPLSELDLVTAASGEAGRFGSDERSRLEVRLFSDVRKPIEVDGAIAWFLLRPLSTRLTRLVWTSPITPNQISVIALLIGVAAGPVAARGTKGSGVAAACLLVLNLVLDCVDGELARLTHRRSRLGEWLDTIGDDASLISYLLGLGLAVRWPLPVEPFGVAASAALLFAGTSVYVYSVLVRQVGKVDTALFPHAIGSGSLLAYAMKRDFFVLLFLILAVAGFEWISLMLIAAGAVANAVGVFGSSLLGAARRRTAT